MKFQLSKGVCNGFVAGGLALLSTTSMAAKPYGMAGCGLGSLVIEPSGSQTSASTTNGTAYNQLFGISSGTSNCKTSAELAVIQKQEDFIATNLGTLSKEMAQGTGESLAAFSETLGCEQTSFGDVAAELKSNYHTIFKAPGAMAVLDTSKDILRSNPELQSRCQYLN